MVLQKKFFLSFFFSPTCKKDTFIRSFGVNLQSQKSPQRFFKEGFNILPRRWLNLSPKGLRVTSTTQCYRIYSDTYIYSWVFFCYQRFLHSNCPLLGEDVYVWAVVYCAKGEEHCKGPFPPPYFVCPRGPAGLWLNFPFFPRTANERTLFFS